MASAADRAALRGHAELRAIPAVPLLVRIQAPLAGAPGFRVHCVPGTVALPLEAGLQDGEGHWLWKWAYVDCSPTPVLCDFERVTCPL